MTKVTIGSGYCSIQELYNRIALACEINPNTVSTYDCSKICVSPRVQDEIFNYYRDQAMTDIDIGMMWVVYGPKAIPELSEHEVTVEEGWYTLTDVQ